MKCAGLKEQCEWPEVEEGKGKVKEVAMSLRGGEKRKKKKTVTKVDDDDDIVEVPGPSGQRSGFNPEPFLEWLDRLTRAVEEMTRQMRRVVDATRLVVRGNERLTAGFETFLEECRSFTALGRGRGVGGQRGGGRPRGGRARGPGAPRGAREPWQWCAGVSGPVCI